MPSRFRLGRVARGATYLAALAVLFTARTPADAPVATAPPPAAPEARHLPPDSQAPGRRGVAIRVLLGGVILVGLVGDVRGRPAWR